MNKSIGCFVVCLLGVSACHVEDYGNCKDDLSADGDASLDVHIGSAGTKASGGHAGASGSTSTSAGAGSGASAGSAGSSATSSGGSTQIDAGGSTQIDAGGAAAGEAAAPAAVVPITPCEKERDCAPGYNCDLEQHECLAADQETCGELDSELACTNRKDCTPIYGGTNCSCGQDCSCHGGEPGCVCESFQFFICQNAP